MGADAARLPDDRLGASDTPDAWFAAFAAGLAADQTRIRRHAARRRHHLDARAGQPVADHPRQRCGPARPSAAPAPRPATASGSAAPSATARSACSPRPAGSTIPPAFSPTATACRVRASNSAGGRTASPAPAWTCRTGWCRTSAIICRASGVAAEIDARRRAAVRRRPAPANMLERCLTGGDDYELLIAVPPAREAALQQASKRIRHTGHAHRPLPRRHSACHRARRRRGRNAPHARRLEPLRMNRNVWLLFVCQALIGASAFCQVAIVALIGHSLALDKSLATLPCALQMLGTMCASIPAGLIFARPGPARGLLPRRRRDACRHRVVRAWRAARRLFPVLPRRAADGHRLRHRPALPLRRRRDRRRGRALARYRAGDGRRPGRRRAGSGDHPHHQGSAAAVSVSSAPISRWRRCRSSACCCSRL